MSPSKFNIGDKVFAKMKGYAPWPAKIDGIAGMAGNKVKYHVYFYGTKQIAICKEEELFTYQSNIEKFGQPKKLKMFNLSMKEAEADIVESGDSNLVPINIKYKSCCRKNVESNCSPRSLKNVSELHPETESKKLKNGEGSGDECDGESLLLKNLKIEARMLDIQYGVQTNLSLKKANTAICLKYLDELINLNLTPLMIKKHSEILTFLKQLQNYCGNVQAWNFSTNEIDVFFGQSAMIRSKAKLAYNKVQSLFHVPFGMSFVDFFENEMCKFRKHTECLTPEEFFKLIKDP